MKKLLSIILAIALLISTTFTAFADDSIEANSAANASAENAQPAQENETETKEPVKEDVIEPFFVRITDDAYIEKGMWMDSGLLDDMNKGTRLADPNPGNVAYWEPIIEKAGYYSVYIYKIFHANSAPSIEVTVNSADGEETIELDYTKGKSEWVNLGIYYFSEGQKASISLTGSGGYIRSGPVKFEPATEEQAMASDALFTDLADTEFAEEIEFLARLGIIDTTEEEFRPTEDITYGEFLDFYKKCLNSDMTIEEELYDEYISYDQVVEEVIKLLGYDVVSSIKGTLATANKLNLLKGTTKIDEEYVTRDTVAKIIYNALSVDVMTVSTVGKYVEYETRKDVTLLQEYMKIDKIKVRVTANHHTTLTGRSSLEKGYVKLGEELYFAGDTKAEDYIGQYITAYVRENPEKGDIKEILYIEPETYEKDIINVFSEDILPTTTTRQFYYMDEQKSKNVKIAINPVVIYNGVAKKNYSKADFKPVYGEVTLIDSDRNGDFDVIIANHYKTIIVDSIDIFTKKVYAKYETTQEWKSFSFDDDLRKKVDIVNNKGEEQDVSKIREWDVISILKSDDGNSLKMIVTRSKARGKIEAIAESENELIINGKTYFIAYNAFPDSDTLLPNLRDEVMCCVDFLGNIVDFEYENSTKKKYGFLYAAANSGTIKVKAEFKIFTEDNEWKIYETREKVIFNGQRVDKDTLMSSSLIFDGGGETIKQLVSFAIDSAGKITLLNCVDSALGVEPENPKMGKITLNYEAAGGITVNDEGNLHLLASKYLLYDDTHIFQLPENLDNEEEYKVLSSDSIRKDFNLNKLKIYDVDENYCASAITMVESLQSASFISSSPVGIVTKITYARNDNGDYVPTLTIKSKGEPINIFMRDNLEHAQFAKSVLSDPSEDSESSGSILPELIELSKLQKGDVVQYEKDSSGKVKAIRVLYRANSPLAAEHDGTNVSPYSETSTYSAVYYAYGQVEKNTNYAVLMKVPKTVGGLDNYSRLHLSGANVLIYLKETEEVIDATAKDIIEGDNIFIYKGMGATYHIIIYR